MDRIRVLLMDEDVVSRQLLVHLLREEASTQISGVALEPSEVAPMLLDRKTDVVLFDLDAAGGSGIDAVRAIKQQYPELRIIGLTRRAEESGDLVIDALRAGVDDFLTKPDSAHGMLFASRHFAKRLVPAVRAVMGRRKVVPETRPKTDPASGQDGPRPVDMVVVGGGMGGPHALFSLIPSLPASFPVPVLVAQHMPRGFTAALADRLDASGRLRVREATSGARPASGEVWIAPGGYHLTVARDHLGLVLRTHRGPRANGSRPSIDVLFRSAVEAAGSRVLGVILSAHGSDGAAAARGVCEAGGRVLVQDAESARTWELPELIVRPVPVQVAKLDQMGSVVCGLVGLSTQRSGWNVLKQEIRR